MLLILCAKNQVFRTKRTKYGMHCCIHILKNI